MMYKTLYFISILTLAACSNGGSSSGGGTAGAGEVGANGDSDLVFEDIASAAASGSDADAVAFASTLATFQADVQDVDGRPLDDYNFTAFVEVPETGSASYSGLINVNAGAAANLSAGLDIDVNFATEVLTAEQTSDFYANSGGALVGYDGTLTFTNGKINARGVDNSARLDIAGTLTGDGNTVAVDGEIFGKLVGTPVVGLSANTTVAEAAAHNNAEREMTITLNGDTVTNGSAGFVVIDDTLR